MFWKIGGRKKTKVRPISKADLQQFDQLKELFAESCGIMGKTTKLSTFLSRYEDTRRFIGGMNDILKKAGEDQLLDLYDDVDQDFVDRVGAVVEAEIVSASALRTDKGRRDRLTRIVQELEAFDRPDGGLLDDAIMEAEYQVNELLDRGIDWAKEPPGELGIGEDLMMGALEKAVEKEGRQRGLSKAQIEEAWRDTFGK